jgi:hypothetical protein
LEVDGAPHAGLPVAFGPAEIVFQLFCDGSAVLSEGLGGEISLRVAGGWPVTTGAGDGVLALRRVPPAGST